MVYSVSEGGNGWLDQTRLEEKEDPTENGAWTGGKNVKFHFQWIVNRKLNFISCGSF